MQRKDKGSFMKLVTAAPLFLLLVFFVSSTFVIDESFIADTSIKLYISRSILRLGGNNVSIEMYVPENYETAQFSQSIQDTSLKINFTPPITETQDIVKDDLGNRIVRVSFKNVKACSLEMSLALRLTSQIKSLPKVILYPYNLSSVNHDILYFLEPTEFIPTKEFDLLYLNKKLNSGQNNVFNVVFAIRKWVMDSINFNAEQMKNDTMSVLTSREGNREGILNLIISLLRISNIPTRACIGISLPQTYETNQEQLVFENVKGIYTYLEIWLPNHGWVSFDPFIYSFLNLNHFVKFGHALDFQSMKYFSYQTSVSNTSITETFAIEYLKNELSKLNLKKSDFNRFEINTEVFKSIENSVNEDESINTYLPYVRDEALKKPLNAYYDKNNMLEMRIDKKTVYMPIVLKKNVRLKKIALPLFKSSFKSANILIRLYDDDKGIPGKVVAQSALRSFNDLPYGAEELSKTFLEFLFNNISLDAGIYYITLYSKSALSDLFLQLGLTSSSNNILPMFYYENKKKVETNLSVLYKLFEE